MNKKCKNRQHGGILVFVVVAMFAMVGLAGLTLDFGHFYMVKSDLQNVADSVALACTVNNDADACGTVTGSTIIEPNVKTKISAINPKGYNVRTEYATSCPDASAPAICAKVTVTHDVPLYLLYMIEGKKLTATVTAISGQKGGESSCFTTINGISAVGNNTIDVNGCGVEAGGNLDMGNSMITVDDGYKITVHGQNADCSSCESGTVVKTKDPMSIPSFGEPVDGISLADFPDPKSKTDTACNKSTKICNVTPNTRYASKITLENNYTYNFPAGKYVFKKGLVTTGTSTIQGPTVSGNWKTNDSTGVMFYISGGEELTLDGTVKLKAPSDCTGTEKSYVIYNPSPVYPKATKWSGSGVQINLIGYTDLSGQDIEMYGTSGAINVTGTLVANSIKFAGGIKSGTHVFNKSGCASFNLTTPGRKILFQ